MKNLLLALIGALSIVFYSCENIFDSSSSGLNESEVVKGLKKALEVGTDTATSVLSAVDGYYGNPLMKIPLPDEVASIQNTINKNNTIKSLFNNSAFSLDNQLEKVVKSINKSAESAAKDAAPVFRNAITGMSVVDAWAILKGKNPKAENLKSGQFDSTAATAYFKSVTYNSLVKLYAPNINKALNQDLGLGFNANDTWGNLMTQYNSIVSNPASKLVLSIANTNLPESINTNLGEFCTGKALDGLYKRVGKEEKKIRKNPFNWAVDILRKVFG